MVFIFFAAVYPSRAAFWQHSQPRRNSALKGNWTDPPISSFCWGMITALGQTVRSDDHVKGALLLGRHDIDSWDWAEHARTYGGLSKYHKAGIQPQEVEPYISSGQQVIFLSAGVVGNLELAETTRAK